MGDYFLNDLCTVCKQYTLPNRVVVSVRALSDVEQRQRELEALRLSATLAERLKDEQSADYQSIILPLLQGEPDALKNNLLAFKRIDATREAALTIRPRYLPFPDNASDEEKRDVVIAREKQNATIAEEKQVYVTKELEKTRLLLETLPDADLRHQLKRYAINGSSYNLYSDEYIRQTVYISTETEDGKRRYFASVDEVRRLNPKVRDFLWRAYVEVDSIDPFNLPSPSVTESLTA